MNLIVVTKLITQKMTKMKKTHVSHSKFPALLAAACVLLPLAGQAATYNATTDFTTTSASLVNGVWSYGHVNTSGTNAVLMNQSSTSFLGFPGMWGWNTTSEVLSIVYKNESAGVVGGFPPPGVLALHPADTATIGIPFIMFTAPSTGSYLVGVSFTLAGGGGVMASVSGNLPWGAGGAAIGYGNQALAPNDTWAYNNTLALNAGDNVVFAVGPNPGAGGGMTLLNTLTVTQVPEPSTFALALAGGLAWAGSRRRHWFRL